MCVERLLPFSIYRVCMCVQFICNIFMTSNKQLLVNSVMKIMAFWAAQPNAHGLVLLKLLVFSRKHLVLGLYRCKACTEVTE